MEKEIFSQAFTEKLNKNFISQSKYFDFKLEIFSEFNSAFFEINKCLILEFNKASITLTNHVLERLLKIALIYNDAGIEPQPIEKWYEIFSEPNRMYSSINMGESIERCKKKGLITEMEKDFLFKSIRELMRNGFSHADSTKILESLPDESEMYQANLTNPTEMKKVLVNQKVVPFMQALQLDEFAKQYSKPYFEFVFNLTFKIEKRLKNKNRI